MSGSLHAYPHAHSSLLQVSIEALCLSITVVQFLFTTLTGLFHKKYNRLKARVVIYAYQHHVRLLSPEPLVVKQPKFTRVEEPTLLCNHIELSTTWGHRFLFTWRGANVVTWGTFALALLWHAV